MSRLLPVYTMAQKATLYPEMKAIEKPIFVGLVVRNLRIQYHYHSNPIEISCQAFTVLLLRVLFLL